MPTDEQLLRAVLSGWEYLEDGIFCKGDTMGYFTCSGWVTED